MCLSLLMYIFAEVFAEAAQLTDAYAAAAAPVSHAVAKGDQMLMAWQEYTVAFYDL